MCLTFAATWQNLNAQKESFVLEAKLHTHAAQLRQQRVLHSANLCQISIVQEGSVTTRSKHFLKSRRFRLRAFAKFLKSSGSERCPADSIGQTEGGWLWRSIMSTSFSCWNVPKIHGFFTGRLGADPATASLYPAVGQADVAQVGTPKDLQRPEFGFGKCMEMWFRPSTTNHPSATNMLICFSVALLWKLLKIEGLLHMLNPSCQSSQVHVGRLWCSAGGKADQGGFSCSKQPSSLHGTKLSVRGVPSGVVCGSPKLCPQRSQARGGNSWSFEMMMAAVCRLFIHYINR